ncbi:MAG: Lrp/AsnC family transcriptional regulator [Solirubrobacterales bacterium]
MASRVEGPPEAASKARARADGAAIALDDTDKQLLNLLQSKFPLDERPFAIVGELAGMDEREVLDRTQRLLDQRIIREITPIFDTPALGYSSMLVAAKVDASHPHRAAAVINEHPGVSHNYLRNHEFNLWFTIATPPDSKLGLEGTLEVLGKRCGASSMRQLPTITMFKISMNLEMEKGTDALAAAAEATKPLPREPVSLDEFDIAYIRALQGPMEVRSDAYAPCATKLGVSVEQVLEHGRKMIERRALRRVAAILFHRRAGFSANGMGVWSVPAEQVAELGPRMAAVRGISHCYQRPTYADWPYSVFTMAHGRSKQECDAVLDGVATVCGLTGDGRATLYSSTEYKKVRLRYFTADYAAWESKVLSR